MLNKKKKNLDLLVMNNYCRRKRRKNYEFFNFLYKARQKTV